MTRGAVTTRRPLFVGTLVVIVVGVVIAVVGAVGWFGADRPEPPPERRQVESVAGSGNIRPLPAAAPLDISVPVVDLHVEVGIQPPPVDGVLVPPDGERGYWLDDRAGVGADADDTAYLIGHSAAVGPAAFNALVNREQQRSSLYAGDEIIVTTEHGEVVYIVQRTMIHEQSRLADIADLWTASPGRLVLISCLFDDQGRPTDDNVVIYARLAPESSGGVS